MENIDKAKIILESEITDHEAKSIGVLGAFFGVDNESIIHNMIGVMDSNSTKQADHEIGKLRLPKDYTTIERIIHKMLIENTGVAMMDSGGAYGRHWQSNRSVNDFRKLPSANVDFWSNCYTFTKDVFHFLTEQLEYSEDMTRKFKNYTRRKENRDSGYFPLMEDFAKEIHDGRYPEAPITENTYNFECVLSQTLQFTIFVNEGKDYLILQIHGGCDVRGGYTEPKIFTFANDWETFLMGLREISASCDCIHPYSDDSGYHWYDTDDVTDHGKFPSIWHWSNRLKGIYCQQCKQKVEFD